MSKQKRKEYVVLKDIIIPAGTKLQQAPVKTERADDGWYDCVIGLSDNSYGYLTYDLSEIKELSEWFAELKE